MKILPCKTCHAAALARRRPEILLTVGSIMGRSVSYLCHRCGRLQRLTAPEFSRLPRITPQQVDAANFDLRPAVSIPVSTSRSVPIEDPHKT